MTGLRKAFGEKQNGEPDLPRHSLRCNSQGRCFVPSSPFGLLLVIELKTRRTFCASFPKSWIQQHQYSNPSPALHHSSPRPHVLQDFSHADARTHSCKYETLPFYWLKLFTKSEESETTQSYSYEWGQQCFKIVFLWLELYALLATRYNCTAVVKPL